jgi:hypothetical protein
MASARYVLTAKRRAALRKAQLASARKRRGKRRKVAIASGVTAGVLGAGVARHKISGSKISVRITSSKSLSGAEAVPGAKGYIRTGKGLDVNRVPTRFFTAATRVSKSNRRGVSIPRAILGVGPVRGRRTILTYEHKALFGKKTKSVVKVSDPRNSMPSISNSINWRIANDPVWSARVKGKNPPGGSAKSRAVTKAMRKEWVKKTRADQKRRGITDEWAVNYLQRHPRTRRNW